MQLFRWMMGPSGAPRHSPTFRPESLRYRAIWELVDGVEALGVHRDALPRFGDGVATYFDVPQTAGVRRRKAATVRRAGLRLRPVGGVGRRIDVHTLRPGSRWRAQAGQGQGSDTNERKVAST